MSPKSFLLTEALHGYLLGASTPLDPALAALAAETAALVRRRRPVGQPKETCP